MPRVYLAGPIAGLSYEEARNGWRQKFSLLLPEHIKPFSPMRAKQFLRNETKLKSEDAINGKYAHAMSSARGLTTRDRNDVINSHCVVANFIGAKVLSAGTCIEFGWADLARVPVVMVIEPFIVSGDNNPHWHPMLTDIAGYIVHELEHAAYIVKHLLTEGI